VDAPLPAGPKAEIPSVDWWTTSHCNLACDFCYGPVPGKDPVGNVLQPAGARYVRRGNCLEEPLDRVWAEIPARSTIINNKRWLSVLS